MKRIILVVIVMTLIIACGIAEQFFINKTLVELEEQTEEIMNLLLEGNYTQALENTQKTKDWWYKKRDILEFLCPNNDIKEIAREIGTLEGTQLALMYEDAITSSNVLQEMAKNSRNLLAYKIKNVF